MSQPSASPDKRVSRQFLYAAFAEGLLLAGVVLFFITLIINFSVEYISSKGLKRSK